jgi:hypothetical protein
MHVFPAQRGVRREQPEAGAGGDEVVKEHLFLAIVMIADSIDSVKRAGGPA